MVYCKYFPIICFFFFNSYNLLIINKLQDYAERFKYLCCSFMINFNFSFIPPEKMNLNKEHLTFWFVRFRLQKKNVRLSLKRHRLTNTLLRFRPKKRLSLRSLSSPGHKLNSICLVREFLLCVILSLLISLRNH